MARVRAAVPIQAGEIRRRAVALELGLTAASLAMAVGMAIAFLAGVWTQYRDGQAAKKELNRAAS